MTSKLAQKFGPWALITGSSSGIGEEFANQVAASGINLVLAARRTAQLEAIAARLQAGHGVEVKVVSVDLAANNFLESLREVTDDLDIGLVVSSAGAMAEGALITREPSQVDFLVQLNVRAPTLIAHHYGRQLASRGKGGILLVASTIGYQPAALVGEYGATKAHNLYLGEALNGELKRHGVTVTVMSPGPTRTDMTANAEMDMSKVPMLWMDASAVARAGLNGLVAGKPSVVAGRVNSVFAWFGRRLPITIGRVFSWMMAKALPEHRIKGIAPAPRLRKEAA